MNSLVKVFSNFKEFYNEINGATLTGAIDVIVVEQPNGDFKCSPFHVRFGKLGVLRSREKVVDIEINGEPVDIHMKLGDSGEAFFVEEIPEEDIESLPDNLATSPIPSNYFPDKFGNVSLERENSVEEKCKIASDDIQLPLVLPRRNSIDLSKETDKEEVGLKIENQVSDFSHRRHTDNTLNRSNLRQTVKEYTTQKIRQEWAEQQEEIFQFEPLDSKDKEWANSTHSEVTNPPTGNEIAKDETIKVDNTTLLASEVATTTAATDIKTKSMNNNNNNNNLSPDNSPRVEESKSKKKRRKKTQMKKKNAQRKSSSSSSICSNNQMEAVDSATTLNQPNPDDIDSVSLSNKSVSMSIDDGTKSLDQISAPLLSARNGDESPIIDEVNWQSSPMTPASRIHDLDIHFFSDTEVTSSGGIGPCNGVRSIGGRPSTPIQSDSELEISMREKDADVEMLKNSASWKWGQLPTPKDGITGESAEDQAQAQRSMLSGMFNFMKKTNKIRKQANEDGVYLSELVGEGMDQDLAAMYLPQDALLKEKSPVGGVETAAKVEPGTVVGVGGEDDRESGNGTSLPQSPSSMEGQKSTDSDYDDGGKPRDEKYLDFVAMSLCGMSEKGDPTEEEFDRQLIKYGDVCQNPSLFTSPNLVVRLNGKYYSWAAACPIVMSIITFQKPLSNDVIEQLISNAKPDTATPTNVPASTSTTEVDNTSGSAAAAGGVVQGRRSWWYWRRSQNGNQESNPPPSAATGANKSDDKLDDKDVAADRLAGGTPSRPDSPDVSDNTLSKTESTLNAENTSAMVENLEDLSQASSKNGSLVNGGGSSNKGERYKKSLRLSSEAIKKLNLKMGMNEIEFSVTTAYQGTTRCKCFLFRWNHNDKVVISDIDGTITRSDVLGHILPMVGKDWAQLGVAELFSKIEMNGYKLLYLSARAIGQARATRDYLRSIRQGNVTLPDGPLLLNPTSLISAFHREVIERKPEQFKIACLSDIRELFPVEDPFYAGYGNRINDVWAYRAVGIPIMRIFTINTKGELKHELTQTFQSSGYLNQSLEVDEYFPALDEYDSKTDPAFDDDIEDELQFDEASDSLDDDDDDDNDSGEDLFSDDYADGSNVATEANNRKYPDEPSLVDVKNELLSYSRMTSIADQLFPPIQAETLDMTYSNFNYWRNPIPTIDLDLDASDIVNTTRNSQLNSSLSKALSTIPEN